MKHLLHVNIISTLLINAVFAQNRVKENQAAKFIGKDVEIMGRVYFTRSINKDYAIIKLGYSLGSDKLQVYFKFKNAATLAGLINHEFGHFIGTLVLCNNKATLIVSKLSNARCYVPKNELVDSANYYQKKGEL